MRDFETSGLGVVAYCREHGYNTKSFIRWRREYAESGEAGLEAKPNPRNTGGRTGRVVPADERRAIIEAFLKLKLPRSVFAAQYGISPGSIANWLKAYEEHGPKGLEPKARGRKQGSGGKPFLPEAVRAQVLETKRSFPHFGMRKVKDYIKRFFGMKVSPGGVRSTLLREDIQPLKVTKKRKRSSDRIRRFERAKPSELWQTDITSFVLTRHSTRVFLVVFLDDCSRYVVAWGLATRPSAAWVCEVVMEGVARFGKPQEILSDRGPQYFAWRGKSAFQKLLDREGIRHVLARAQHPQTVGKCERLWETVGKEFWERAKPQDLVDARERLSHYFAHYNHFRPHQGLDGALPADRFFGAEDALRETIEQAFNDNELDTALSEAPRKRVYLMGQIGDRKVSLHGERGRIEVHTEAGLLEGMNLEDAGVDVHARPSELSTTPENDDEAEREAERSEHASEHERGAAEPEHDDRDQGPPDAQAALQEPAETGDRGAGPAGSGERAGAQEGAGDVCADPRAVAGQDQQGGDLATSSTPALAGVAAEPASAVGDDRGPARPTTDEATRDAGSGSREHREEGSGDGHDAAAARDRAPEAGPDGEQPSERALEAVSGADAAGEGAPRGAACDQARCQSSAQQGAVEPAASSANGPQPNCDPERSHGDNASSSPGTTA
ncbi:MAG: DDE-type integrase/transposase/recombinase [Planctomycetes bacterium]|nr:DDE-type integrase/transposase/recombinase [Planctomycetota bacterium]